MRVRRPRSDMTPEGLADREKARSLGPFVMRMRGLEPPRAVAHSHLKTACLPIPPHPRGRPIYRARTAYDRSATLSTRILPLSSRGLGRSPLTAETGVRIPVAVLHEAPAMLGLSRVRVPTTSAAPGVAALAGSRQCRPGTATVTSRPRSATAALPRATARRRG